MKQIYLKTFEPLAPLTTIKLGGVSDYIFECYSPGDIKDCLAFSKRAGMPVYVLGGGSNVVFPDGRLKAIVLHNKIPGISINDNIITTGAGVKWDDVVEAAVNSGLQGIECLSGIPGSAGAVPVQNVGAYGQEVKDTILKVKAISRENSKEIGFTNEECRFGYRQSRFKNEDKDKYIITEVIFKLNKNAEPVIKYPELKKEIEQLAGYQKMNASEKLKEVRETVIKIRKRKSMVIDAADPDSVSCGSFFMNPVLSAEVFDKLKSRYDEIPSFASPGAVKVPAAWLVENAGFQKGYTLEGAGISNNHTLALVNRGGAAKSLIKLSELIQEKVYAKFGIRLQTEPVIIK